METNRCRHRRRPADSAIARLCAVPGAGPDSVRAVLGEIGLDMSVFGSAGRICSRAKVALRTVQSGSKTGRARTGPGRWGALLRPTP